MAGTIASAYVQIMPSTEGMKANLTNAMNGSANAAGKSGGKTLGQKLKSAIIAAGIGTAVVKTISSAFKEGAALEQSLGGVETLFKDTAGTVVQNAQNAYKTAGLSANQYMETVTSFSASLLQSLGGDTEKAASVADMALVDMADNANKFGTSMDSIQNAYQGFAKQNYTMLDNLKLGYGGTKSEMERLLADASKLSGVKYDISNLNDVYEAIHVVQTELGVTETTAAEASTTIQGSLSSMQAAWANLLGAVATGGDVSTAAANLATSAGTFAANALGMINQIIPGIVSALPQIITAVTALLPELTNTIIQNLPLIIEAGIQLFTGLVQALPLIIPQFVAALPGFITQISGAIVENLPIIIAAGIQLFQAIARALPTVLPEILVALGQAIVDIAGAVIEGIPQMLGAGLDLIAGLADGIWQGIQALLGKVGAWCQSIIDKVKGVFGIHSPSRVFREIGGYLMEGLGEGITDNEDIVEKAMDKVSTMTSASMKYEFGAGRGMNQTNNIYTSTMDEGQQQRLLMLLDRQMGALA